MGCTGCPRSPGDLCFRFLSSNCKRAPAYLHPYVHAEDHIQALRLSEEALYWMSNCPTRESESTLLFLLQDKVVNFESLVLICVLLKPPALSFPCSQFSLCYNLFTIFFGHFFFKRLSFHYKVPCEKEQCLLVKQCLSSVSRRTRTVCQAI